MERSFARSVRFGFKRARWRRLWRVQIQEYLTAAIQNIMILIENVKEPQTVISLAIKKSKHSEENCLASMSNKFCSSVWLLMKSSFKDCSQISKK
jgi:hypothetical protein